MNFEYRTTIQGSNFLHADHPFTINGNSPASTGGAHNKNAPDDLGAKAGQEFILENKSDPLEDVMDHALTIPLVYFSTLETVIQRMGYTDHIPDYAAWYHYALSARKDNAEMAPRIMEILSEHALRTGTQDQLEAAKNTPAKAKRTLGERLTRIKTQIASFRVSAEKDGENTILSAAHIYDDILGDHYGSVLQGATLKNSAWKGAHKRSKAYTRQL